VQTNALLLSDHILEALSSLAMARRAVTEESPVRREAVVYSITEAEKSLGHVLGLIAGAPN
jgi:DNA-binding HxlR family transcriptional regulator